MKRILFFSSIAIVLILSITIWWRYYFVYGEGVKAGNLNFFVKKGYIFKSYEGRLIQEGLKPSMPGVVQSNEFNFSVANDEVATILEQSSGKVVELRYVEYLNPLPWRGMSNYVVIEVVNVEK